MPQIIVPKAVAENPTGGGGNKPFPEGAWNGTLEEVRSRDFPEWVTPKSGYVSSMGEILGVQFGETEPLEGQEDAGKQKIFLDLVVQDGDRSVDSIDVLSKDEPSWQMQRSAKMLASLALALGATEDVEDADGKPAVAIMDGFVEALREGQFKGQRVSFVVYHRTYTTKAGEPGVESILQSFGPAV